MANGNSSQPLTVDKAQIIAVFCTDILYGAYLVTFFSCLRAIVWDPNRYHSMDSCLAFKRRRDIHWPMLAVALIFFVFLTADVIFGLAQTLRAFVEYKGPGGAVASLSDVSDWLNLIMSMAVFVPVALNDAVLIYRCWIVYLRSFIVIILPTFLWIGEVICAVLLMWYQSTVDTTGQSMVHIARLQPTIMAFAIITIFQNLIVTSLIVYRIRRIDKANSLYRLDTGPSRLKKASRIIIESGLIVTTTAILCFIANAAGSNAFYITTSAAIPICGIAFNLIVIRANSQSSEEYAVHSPGPGYSASGPHISFSANQARTIEEGSSQFQIEPEVVGNDNYDSVALTERSKSAIGITRENHYDSKISFQSL